MSSVDPKTNTKHNELPLTAEDRLAVQRGVIAWFTRNPVAANLMMAFLILGGGLSLLVMPRTLTPAFEVYWIQVLIPYPGATPEEVELSVVLKVEEALREVEGLKSVVSRSQDSLGNVTVQVDASYDLNVVQSEIRAAVESISHLPADAERPIIQKVPILRHVIQLELFGGEMDDIARRELADEIKLELLQLPDISKVVIYGAQDYEISIEIAEETLLKYGLSLADIGIALQRQALDLPGGSIRTVSGDVLLQAKGRRYTQREFEETPIISFPDGTTLKIGDIATVRDGFVEKQRISRLNGKDSIGIAAEAYNNQDVLTIAAKVREYTEKKRPDLPPGVRLEPWADVSHYLQGRITMMQKNLFLGALLVFLVLILFMDVKLAFWVMLGIPISFCGAFVLIPHDPFNVTLNLVSLFALILVLGIVVDDAIIVGESAYAAVEKSGHSIDNVVRGVQRVAVPAIFGVLTTIIAFAPTAFLTGQFAAFPNEIGYTVILCLFFSLVESKLILPAHLAHTRPSSTLWLAPFRAVQRFNNHLLRRYVIESCYRPLLQLCIKYRYLTISLFMGLMFLFIGLFGHGYVRFVLIDSVPGDFIEARLEMVNGTPAEQTVEHLETIEKALMEVDREIQQESGKKSIKFANMWSVEDLKGIIFVELLPQEQRSISGRQFLQRWREKTGRLPGTKILAFSDTSGDEGQPIAMRLTGKERKKIEEATAEVERELNSYRGVFDIRTDIASLNDELHITPRPAAEVLGLSLADIGEQVRHAFYGFEAMRLQRGNDEVKVLVRFPRQDRRSITTLQNMYIHTKNGESVPLSTVAEIEARPGAANLVRIDSEPAIGISADADTAIVSPGEITSRVLANQTDLLAQRYEVVLGRDSVSAEQTELTLFLLWGFMISMLLNYSLLAVPLRSYSQPLIVMGAVPFGLIGAIIGHLIMDLPVSMLSIFGVVAASGVVVNDGLILVDFINKGMQQQGLSRTEATIRAGCERFRAIMLTSLTTFFGLLPIMLEQSAQARYVIPMAVSLSFGVIFATVITLLLLPCLNIALADFSRKSKISDTDDDIETAAAGLAAGHSLASRSET